MRRAARDAGSTWRRLGVPTLSHGILLTGSLAMVFPFVWMLATSFKPADETLLGPPGSCPCTGCPSTTRRCSRPHPLCGTS